MEVSTIHLLYHWWFWSWTKNQKLFIDIDYVMILFVQFSHLAWVQTDRKSGGLGDLKYPLISDVTKSISKSYGVLIPDQVWGALFLIIVFLKEHIIPFDSFNVCTCTHPCISCLLFITGMNQYVAKLLWLRSNAHLVLYWTGIRLSCSFS